MILEARKKLVQLPLDLLLLGTALQGITQLFELLREPRSLLVAEGFGTPGDPPGLAAQLLNVAGPWVWRGVPADPLRGEKNDQTRQRAQGKQVEPARQGKGIDRFRTQILHLCKTLVNDDVGNVGSFVILALLLALLPDSPELEGGWEEMAIPVREVGVPQNPLRSRINSHRLYDRAQKRQSGWDEPNDETGNGEGRECAHCHQGGHAQECVRLVEDDMAHKGVLP